MRHAIALLVSAAAIFAAGGATAEATITPYAEGPPEASTPIVRPLNGVNTWYWWIDNDRAQRIVVCFRYQIDGGVETSPIDGKPYAIPQGSTLPNGCDQRPYELGAKQSYFWRLPAPHGSRVRWCAVEYLYDSPTAGRKVADSEVCTTVRIDGQPPVIGIALSDAQGRQGATNDANNLRRTISYSDDVSPAWGDTRICRITDRACQNNGLDPFDYQRDCSDEPLGLNVRFQCSWLWPRGDARVYQCALSFDSASGDRAPDLTRAPASDNPSYTTPGTGNFAIACSSIVIDRAAPRIEIRTSPSKPRAGHPVKISARTDDGPVAGSIGPYRFDLGDGTVIDSSASRTVRHTYAKRGNYSVVVTARDGAGNRGLTVNGLTVRRPHPLQLSAPRRITRTRRTLPVELHSDRLGSVRITLLRKSKRVAARSATIKKPGTRELRLRLPRNLRTGAYELRAAFTRTGAKRVSERAKRTLRVEKKT